MNMTMRATLLAIILLNLSSEGWTQIQISNAKPSTVPGAENGGAFDAVFSSGFAPSSVIQASHCTDCGLASSHCECNDGFSYASPCTGACGGRCAGGCGKSGVLSKLLGRHGNGWGRGVRTSGGWLEAEYLLWWSKDRYVPALATQSPGTTDPAVAGQLGQPTTSILFGNERIDSSPDSGFRVSIGTWLDEWQSIGIGSRYYYVEGEEDFRASSAGDPFLARPFFNTINNVQDAILIAEPGVSSGSINIRARNEVSGSDFFLRKILLSGHCNRLDLIGGYSRSDIEDSVEIRDSLTALDASRVPIDTVLETRDFFEVKNKFHGGFIGFILESADGPLSWSTMGKVAVGNMNQEARISGSSTTSVPGAGMASNPFGLLALPSNIGRSEQDEFAIVPELNVSVRYNVTKSFQLSMGYSFIYWSQVALSGDLIDLNVNTTQIDGNLVGPGAPTRPPLKSDGFWYTGISFGGAFHF